MSGCHLAAAGLSCASLSSLVAKRASQGGLKAGTRLRVVARNFSGSSNQAPNNRSKWCPPSKASDSGCCGPSASTATPDSWGLAGMKELEFDSDDTYGVVQDYYGKVLETSKDLKTSACCAETPPQHIVDALKLVPQEVKAKFYGCGAPLPAGVEGLRILDLGSGSGRDAYVMSAFVGEKGSVIGVDMTAEQLEVARKYENEYSEALGFPCNMEFREGHIEYLDKAEIADESVDVIISNCVVNLSPDKKRVIEEAYRVLAPGGEFYFSDVYCDRRLPESVQQHPVLFGECLGGALYNEDFKRLARDAGFTDPRVLSHAPIDVKDKELIELCGEARFYSITYRLFKLPGQVETLCEDYGQYAVYKGTIPGAANAYHLDDHHRFEKNKPMLVCGNTAAMVGEDGVSWLSPHFEVFGDRSVHYGIFGHEPDQTCGTLKTSAAASASSSGGGCC